MERNGFGEGTQTDQMEFSSSSGVTELSFWGQLQVPSYKDLLMHFIRVTLAAVRIQHDITFIHNFFATKSDHRFC